MIICHRLHSHRHGRSSPGWPLSKDRDDRVALLDALEVGDTGLREMRSAGTRSAWSL